MEFQKGRRLAIFGALLLAFNTIGSIILNYLIRVFEIALSEAVSKSRTVILSLIDVTGWLLILVGVKYITEEIKRREIYKNLLLAFIIYTIGAAISIVFAGFTARSGSSLTLLSILIPYASILYFILYLISQGVLIPFLFVRLGTTLNSITLKIAGIFLFISVILPLLAGYIFATLYRLSDTWVVQLLTIFIQLFVITTYILLFFGFILLKMPVSTGSENISQE